MFNVMKGLVIAFLLFCCGVHAEDSDLYSHIQQDDVSVGCFEGKYELRFNGEQLAPNELKEKLAESYSVNLFFYEAHGKAVFSVLQMIKESGVDSQLVTVGLRDENECTGDVCAVEILEDGAVLCNGKPTKLAALSGKISSGDAVSVRCMKNPVFTQIYEVIKVVDAAGVPLVNSVITDYGTQVEVSACILKGAETVLKSPCVTTRPGKTAGIRIMSEPHGQVRRLSVTPRLIGKHIRVSGTLEGGNEAVDGADDTIVVPFSAVVPDGAEFVEIPFLADGTEHICRLSVSVQRK